MEYTENEIAKHTESVLADALKIVADAVKERADLLEKYARQNAVPPIKGDITKGKLQWRGISVVVRNEDFAQAVFQRGKQISPFILLEV